MYSANGHRISSSGTPGKKQRPDTVISATRPGRTSSPSRKPPKRNMGATPPPPDLDEESAETWRKYNKILESISRENTEGEAAPPRPPRFDYRGVELVATLAPAFGKYLFLAKAKSFSWWKNSSAKYSKRIKAVDPPSLKGIANGAPAGKTTPFRRIKISTKYSERWSVPTGPHEDDADIGILSASKQYDLRQLKKEHRGSCSPTKNGEIASSPDSAPASVAGDWSDVDLNTLGLMPDIIYPLFHANENTLWKLFSEYVLNDDNLGLPAALRSLAMSTSREQKAERMEARLMTFDTLWTILRDFDVSPDACNLGTLQQAVKYVQFIMGSSSTWSTVDDDEFYNSLNSIACVGMDSTGGSNSSTLGTPKKGFPETGANAECTCNRLSYSEFIKVLWQLSIRCTEKLPNAHPIVHVQKLFRLMDSSDGRKKIGRRHRSSSIIPRFVGCSIKENNTLSSSGAPLHQSYIMQYLRKITSQRPPMSAIKNDASPSKNTIRQMSTPESSSPDGNAEHYSANGLIMDQSISPKRGRLNASTIVQRGDCICTEHDSSMASSKSSGHRFYSERKHPKTCPACSGNARPTPDPLVFG